MPRKQGYFCKSKNILAEAIIGIHGFAAKDFIWWGCAKSLSPPAAAKYYFVRHIIFLISLREIRKMMCLTKHNSARSAMKRLFTQPQTFNTTLKLLLKKVFRTKRKRQQISCCAKLQPLPIIALHNQPDRCILPGLRFADYLPACPTWRNHLILCGSADGEGIHRHTGKLYSSSSQRGAFGT